MHIPATTAQGGEGHGKGMKVDCVAALVGPARWHAVLSGMRCALLMHWCQSLEAGFKAGHEDVNAAHLLGESLGKKCRVAMPDHTREDG